MDIIAHHLVLGITLVEIGGRVAAKTPETSAPSRCERRHANARFTRIYVIRSAIEIRSKFSCRRSSAVPDRSDHIEQTQ